MDLVLNSPRTGLGTPVKTKNPFSRIMTDAHASKVIILVAHAVAATPFAHRGLV